MKWLLVLVSFLSVAPGLGAAGLRCNFGSTDITPFAEERTMLAGFAAREGLSEGIHSELRAGCLVFADGDRKVCLVALDLMELSPALSYELRAEISARTDIPEDHVFLHCIHTHSSPRLGGRWVEEGGANRDYYLRTKEAIVSLAQRTILDRRAFQPFSIEFGECAAYIGGNRCEEGGPVDPTVYAVRIIGRKGKPLCAFINFSCHPVCMGPGSLLVGADYFGVTRGSVSKAWGCEVFQLSGAQGNVDPAQGPRLSDYAEECGGLLAESLLGMVFEPFETDGTLALSTGTACLPYRIPEVGESDVRELAARLKDGYSESFPRFARNVDDWLEDMVRTHSGDWPVTSLKVDMAALNVGGLIFFMTQGEPFCEYQMGARASFPDKKIIFAAYTNGQSAYLPSERAFEVRRGYEYEIEQEFVYTRRPYPVSDRLPAAYREAVFKTIARVAGEPRYSIIPQPVLLEPRKGEFTIDGKTTIAFHPDFGEIAGDFIDRIRTVSGFAPGIGRRTDGGIVLSKVDGLGPEEYRLDITPGRLLVEASGPAGAFYGIQTVLQLLPPAVYGRSRIEIPWTLPCCRIEDYPALEYRGMLLDCGRYYFPNEVIFGFIDNMARHKLNHLHWHITEDQGWRLAIGKYPALTEVGAWRKETSGFDGRGDGVPHGGFYSREDVALIVEYARRRMITVVPEIELPGHSSAAIAAYPWLSCTPDEPKEVRTGWGIMEDVYCPSPQTFGFLEDVFTEVLEMFPSPIYHIGGDECPKTAWRNSGYCIKLAEELGLDSVDDFQSLFVKHFVSFLEDRGKTVVAWDEVLDGETPGDMIVMSYRGHGPASRALARGLRTILCPNRWTYLDNPQQEIDDRPRNQHLFLTLRKSYSWDWESLLDAESYASCPEGVFGIQGCVWTEIIPTEAKMQVHTHPREASLAELAWTPRDKRDWHWFLRRIPAEISRLDAAGVGYSQAFDNVIVNMDLESPYPRAVELEIDNPYATVRYTTDGSEPHAGSPQAPALIRVDRGDTVKARGFTRDGIAIGETMTRTF